MSITPNKRIYLLIANINMNNIIPIKRSRYLLNTRCLFNLRYERLIFLNYDNCDVGTRDKVKIITYARHICVVCKFRQC